MRGREGERQRQTKEEERRQRQAEEEERQRGEDTEDSEDTGNSDADGTEEAPIACPRSACRLPFSGLVEQLHRADDHPWTGLDDSETVKKTSGALGNTVTH